jgi:hypothetical protein
MGNLRTRIAKLEGVRGNRLVCVVVDKPNTGETEQDAIARTYQRLRLLNDGNLYVVLSRADAAL